ncbi:MAG: PAS domain-containing sensor histidine kinase [Desulfobacteraceae bacterium IS3]|nr:MAG: PAS domain-containing sensor histidine kinase [Desulfobacteraceae bacterium IS3]
MFRTFQTKILIGYGGALAVVVLVFAWSILSLLKLGKASDAILRGILAAENMIIAVERQDSAVLLLLLEAENEWRLELLSNENTFLQWLGRAKDNITVEGEGKILDSIETSYTAYLMKLSEIFRGKDINIKKNFYHKEVYPLFQSVRNSCIRLREINQTAMFAASRQAQNVAGRAVWNTVILGMAAVISGLGFSLFLSNMLASPIRHMIKAAAQIAEGNYEVQVPVDRRDELGLLAEQFNIMAKRLKEYNDMNIEKILTEKRKIEAVLQNADDGIIVVSPELKITDMNPMSAKIFGVDLSLSLEHHFLEIVRDEQLFTFVKTVLESGQPVSFENEKNLLSVKTGEDNSYYQYSIFPVNIKTGFMPGVVVLLRDITRLQELDRLKSEFVMTASHELRTPLTSIGMSVEMLMERLSGQLNDKERKLLQAAYEDVQRLKALVNDLLDLSKIEAGQIELAYEEAPVKLFCEKAISAMKFQADQKEIELSFNIQENLPEVKIDPNKITWVLVNLIGNALRFTNQKGHIQVSARQSGDHIHISVSDDGEGIPYEYQSKIFDKFVQVKSEKNSGGSGLGLAISKEIVRAHGGTIWADSVPGKGSTFTFTAPVRNLSRKDAVKC